MIKIKRQFASGYASPVFRGVCFWLDAEKRRDLPLDQLVYEALEDEYDPAYGAELQGVTITIQIEKAGRPGN